jgi:hypothetical protein
MSVDTSEQRNLYGTFWFYSGDVPYFHFGVGEVNIYVNFHTVDYFRPVDDCPRTEDGKELEGEDRESFAYMAPMMKYMRRLEFHLLDKPDSVLMIDSNCKKYSLQYGSPLEGRITLDIPTSKIEALVRALDAAFERGKSDADGDFTKGEDRLVSGGISSFIYFRASTWSYKRTEHEPEEGALCTCQSVPVMLSVDGPIEVIMDPNAPSYAPWKNCHRWND